MSHHLFALSRLTRDSPSFKDELDIMKFICKDFWTKVFRRQVDNLRTNHQVKCYTMQYVTTKLVSRFCVVFVQASVIYPVKDVFGLHNRKFDLL